MKITIKILFVICLILSLYFWDFWFGLPTFIALVGAWLIFSGPQDSTPLSEYDIWYHLSKKDGFIVEYMHDAEYFERQRVDEIARGFVTKFNDELDRLLVKVNQQPTLVRKLFFYFYEPIVWYRVKP